MDIGAFMQAFAAEPMVPNGNGTVGKTSSASGWQPRGDKAADHEAASFIQTVRQILGTADNDANMADEDRQTTLQSAGDMSQITLLLALLGQEGIGELQPLMNPELAPMSDGVDDDLLAMLSEQISELETTLSGVSSNPTENEINLLTLLSTKINTMEASLNESATGVTDETRKDFERTLSLLKIELGKRLDQTIMPPLQGQGEAIATASGTDLIDTKSGDGITAGKISANMQNQMADMVNDHSADAPVDELKNAAAPAKPATTSDFAKESVSTTGLGDAERDSLPMEKAAQPDGRINNAKPLDPPSMPQSDTTQYQQESEYPPGEDNASKSQAMEWLGVKKTPLTGAGMDTMQAQPAASSQKPDALSFVNEKQASQHNRSHQETESDPIKATPLPSARSDALIDESMKATLSTDAPLDNRTHPTTTTRTASMSAPSDTDFQKTVMDQIVEKATLRSVNDRSEIRIQLKPDTLGDVRMSIVSEKNQLVVQMIAEKSETKEIIENQIHHLKAELDKQGLTVAKIEVMISADNDQQNSRGQFFQMFKNNSDGSGKRQHAADQETAQQQHQPNDQKETDSSGDGINYFV